MPEYAEVKLQADNINAIYNKLGAAQSIEVYHTNKRVDTDFSKIEFPVDYKATTRGKELQLILNDNDNQEHKITFTLGMSGEWVFNNKKPHQEPEKHVRFLFQLKSSNAYLGLHDVRRFACWKLREFRKSRGPDPVDSYYQFKEKINNNIDKSVKFEKPIAELLLDQAYFNGIGNYLRSTILYHTNQNPFQSARSALKENDKLIPYCRDACMFAYQKQLQIGNGDSKKAERARLEFFNWKFYQKGLSCKDGTNRTLWFHEDWKSECPYPIKES